VECKTFNHQAHEKAKTGEQVRNKIWHSRAKKPIKPAAKTTKPIERHYFGYMRVIRVTINIVLKGKLSRVSGR
jgi:hypothetical protein